MKRHSESNVHRLSKKKKILPTKEEQKQLQQIDLILSDQFLITQSFELIQQLANDAKAHFLSETLTGWIKILKADLLQNSKKFSCHGRLIGFDWLKKQNFQGLDSSKSDVTEIEYRAPLLIEVVGSTVTQTMTPPYFNVDVVITLPSEIFEER